MPPKKTRNTKPNRKYQARVDDDIEETEPTAEELARPNPFTAGARANNEANGDGEKSSDTYGGEEDKQAKVSRETLLWRSGGISALYTNLDQMTDIYEKKLNGDDGKEKTRKRNSSRG